jgi:hypothetical protein
MPSSSTKFRMHRCPYGFVNSGAKPSPLQTCTPCHLFQFNAMQMQCTRLLTSPKALPWLGFLAIDSAQFQSTILGLSSTFFGAHSSDCTYPTLHAISIVNHMGLKPHPVYVTICMLLQDDVRQQSLDRSHHGLV